MSEFLAYGSIAAAVVSLITIAKFWMDLGAMRRDAKVALQKAETNEKDLADFKTSAAEKYASTQMLAASEGRLTQALESMRSELTRSFGDLNGRIDRMLTAIQGSH